MADIEPSPKGIQLSFFTKKSTKTWVKKTTLYLVVEKFHIPKNKYR